MGIIQTPVMSEGDFMVKWIYNRMVVKNKNIILALTGATGSGKSYTSLRIYELWCKRMGFKPDMIYVCFSISELMHLLTSPDLKRYSIIILEEAGTSLGNLDFQNRVSKLFTYILQSFRSMNIGLILNLPVFTMLNKSARQLTHAHLITQGIDFETNECKIKMKFQQLNQESGKSYWKCPRMKVGNSVRKLSFLKFKRPDEELIKSYEVKKCNFVTDLSQRFVDELDSIERDKIRKQSRNELSLEDVEKKNDLETLSFDDIMKKWDCKKGRVYQKANWFDKKGYKIVLFHKNKTKTKENPQNSHKNDDCLVI